MRLKIIGNILALATFAMFVYLATTNQDAFKYVAFDFRTLLVTAITIAFYIGAMLCGALVWVTLLRASGYPVSVAVGLSMVLVSQAGKYVPGNVAQHLGRIALAKGYGVPINTALFAMFTETIWVVGVASLITILAMSISGDVIPGKISDIGSWWFFVALIGLAAVTPMIMHRVFEYAARWWSERRGVAFESIQMPNISAFFIITALYVLNYTLLGIVLSVIGNGIFSSTEGSLIVLAGIFAVAWVVGFLAPGAPAGIGVREMILVALLTPLYGQSTAIGIAAVLRFITLMGDAIAFALGLGLARLGPTLAKDNPTR